MFRLLKLVIILLVLASFIIMPIQISQNILPPFSEINFQNKSEIQNMGYITQIVQWLCILFVTFIVYKPISAYKFSSLIRYFLLSTFYKMKIEYLLNPVQFQSKLIVIIPSR